MFFLIVNDQQIQLPKNPTMRNGIFIFLWSTQINYVQIQHKQKKESTACLVFDLLLNAAKERKRFFVLLKVLTNFVAQ